MLTVYYKHCNKLVMQNAFRKNGVFHQQDNTTRHATTLKAKARNSASAFKLSFYFSLRLMKKNTIIPKRVKLNLFSIVFVRSFTFYCELHVFL